MNRRKFTKSALGIIALAPFADWNYVKPVFGVDKAIGEDRTVFQIYQSQGTTAIPLNEYAKLAGYDNLSLKTYNCRCAFEFKVKNG